MKKLVQFFALTILASLLSFSLLTAQSTLLKPQVVASSGKAGTAGNTNISYTIGQTVAFNGQAQGTLLTQGFQQPASCIPYQSEIICIVSVDTLSGKNTVRWEKTPFMGTEGYIVYKESSSNVYDSVSYVSYASTAEYVDYFSVPETHSDRYKIMVVDTCGNRSLKSPYHQTINLQISQGVPASTMVLNWTQYVDESGVYIPGKYYIFRGTSPNNLELHDSISGTQTMYNDQNVFDVYYYRLAIIKPGNCDGTKSQSTFSFSNRKDNSTIVGLQNAAFDANLTIYPNPFTSQTTISFGKPITDYRLLITDLSGKVVFEDKNVSGDKYVLQRGDLERGMYLLEITNYELRITRKLVIN
ncbi:MAG: T9SS type A sorting domain-containing protein [Bacteroidetes bacterium]|nr:T9SS type A sorting domain-containing protein [Bacteroidota bacterium]MBU1721054.1 T9SS type A sorting domain-containing protein [Bacteroidota bacterium]